MREITYGQELDLANIPLKVTKTTDGKTTYVDTTKNLASEGCQVNYDRTSTGLTGVRVEYKKVSTTFNIFVKNPLTDIKAEYVGIDNGILYGTTITTETIEAIRQNIKVTGIYAAGPKSIEKSQVTITAPKRAIPQDGQNTIAITVTFEENGTKYQDVVQVKVNKPSIKYTVNDAQQTPLNEVTQTPSYYTTQSTTVAPITGFDVIVTGGPDGSINVNDYNNGYTLNKVGNYTVTVYFEGKAT